MGDGALRAVHARAPLFSWREGWVIENTVCSRMETPWRSISTAHVARVVVVDTNQFRVISHSVKKTDPNDARNLALYLAKGLLPEVRMKEKEQAELASLTQTRDRLGKLRTALKNK